VDAGGGTAGAEAGEPDAVPLAIAVDILEGLAFLPFAVGVQVVPGLDGRGDGARGGADVERALGALAARRSGAGVAGDDAVGIDDGRRSCRR